MPLNQISPFIDNIIEERGKQVAVIEGYIKNINYINGAIKELQAALDNLLQHPQVTQELKSRLQEFGTVSASWTGEIASVIERLENTKTRLARQAVTIGCSGQARVGKSTLLQTIGNLPEEAIPTGKGIPVTAVRSRLRHSHERKAILSLQDKMTFLDGLIKPFHRELNLPIVNSFEEFRNFDYSDPKLITDDTVDLFTRLTRMQAALWSYEEHLTGGSKTIEDLSQLRPWVAYPKPEEEKEPKCSRLYLAVKNVEIQSSFLLEVEKLMLIDLPGLGEVNVDAEEHHVEGLKNEVDLVLLILRPTETTSYWGAKDRKALNLISKSVEGISRQGNFVIIVVNYGENDDPKLYQTLIDDVHQKLNENKPNSRYRVLTCDAKDSHNVKEQILVPVLKHLIDHLTIMDQEILDSSLAQWQSTVDKITIAIAELATSLRTFPSQTTKQGNNFAFIKAKKLRGQLATKLRREVLKELEAEVKQEEDEKSIIDHNLIEEIEKKHQEIQKWAGQNGLGKGKEIWYQEATERFDEDKEVVSFAYDEINRSRTFLTNTYTKLDVYFDNKMEELFQNISRTISDCTGNLIKDATPGKEALEKFLHVLGESGIGDPFPSLREATEYLLQCGTENAVFQSHLLPRLTEETQKLVPETFNFEGTSYQNEQAPELVLQIISARIIQTSHAVQKRLKQNPFISGIRYSAAVKFEDSLLRDEDADIQFFNFASSYTNEIWSEEFQTIERNNHMVKKAEQAINHLQQLLNNSL